MKRFYELSGHQQWVEIENGTILKFSCSCPDFSFRKLKKIGKGPDAKVISVGECKHLKTVLGILNMHKDQTSKHLNGPTKMTKELKNLIMERSKGLCEAHRCSNEGADFHRIIRGSHGGKYTKENTVYLCSKHHKIFHAGEFKSQSK